MARRVLICAVQATPLALPRRSAHEDSLTSTPTAGRVLLVDDDPLVCELLVRMLSKQGFAVSTDASAEEALERLAHEDFDVILTDMNMTGLDGLKFTERILAQRS